VEGLTMVMSITTPKIFLLAFCLAVIWCCSCFGFYRMQVTGFLKLVVTSNLHNLHMKLGYLPNVLQVEIISLQSHRDTTLEVAVPKVEFLDCCVVGYDVLWKIRVLHLDQ
jgi:hypothetical protein